MNIIYNIYLNYILNTKNIKMIDTLKQTLLKGKYAHGQKTYGKVLNNNTHQKKCKFCHNEVLLYVTRMTIIKNTKTSNVHQTLLHYWQKYKIKQPLCKNYLTVFVNRGVPLTCLSK